MGSSESIVDVEIAEPRQLAREGRIVRLLAGVETEVFQEQDLARLEGPGFPLHHLSDAVINPGDGRPEQVLQVGSQGAGAKSGVGLAVGSAEMGRHDHGRSSSLQVTNGRETRDEAAVVAHRAVPVEGNVEVDSE
jgi:hypothetical protein